MGIYDREYYRQERPSFSLNGPRSVVGALVLINIAVYLADWAFTPDPGPLRAVPTNAGAVGSFLSAHVSDLTQPLYWWRFVTYGFAHAVQPQHIILNMLGLFFLGPDVERRYGRLEFLRIYLVTLLAGSLIWAAANRIQGHEAGQLLGASGAVVAIVVLYALNFPHRTLLLFFVIPVPAWFAGLLLVAMDLYGSLRGETHVAYTVHLAGAGFAFLYYRLGWNFGRLLPESFNPLSWLKRRPRLRVRRPDDDVEDDAEEAQLNEEVDRILAKISREGEASLTRKERRILQTASREYQRRRRSTDANNR